MTASTHIAFSAVCWFVSVASANTAPRIEHLAVAGFGSLLPDIDIPTSGIGRPFFPIARRINRLVGHRTLTHSLLGLLLFALLILPLYLLGYRGISLALLLGYASHILLDQVNVMGVDLFWPGRLRAVLFLNERYRIAVAGKGEYILLCAMIVVLLLLYPVASAGLKRSLHLVLGDIQSAVQDFRALDETNEVEVVVAATDALSGEKVSGVYDVIGAPSNTALLINHKERPRLLSEEDGAHLKPHRVWVRSKEARSVSVERIRMAGRTLWDLEGLLHGRRAYLFGELQAADPAFLGAHFAASPDRFATVRWGDGKLRLEYATLGELDAVRAAPIAEGEVLIKYLDGPPARAGGSGDAGSVMALTFRAASLDAVKVRVGDRVAKGDLLALRDDGSEIQSLMTDIRAEKEQGATNAQLSRLALQEVDAEIYKAREELERSEQETAHFQRAAAFFPKELKAARLAREKAQAKSQDLVLKRERMIHQVAATGLEHRRRLRHIEERLEQKRKEREVLAPVSGEIVGRWEVPQDQFIKVHLALRTGSNDRPAEERREGR
ncbi:metal-dependent hydrolase [Candidatus Methylomirabilis sp.]|uniref:Metal-dependent hydrolase n=1 Tax=Candidatus Methylomirabilis tolerans TaxID=3123416 RepID=A0AAJ1AG91_9BACT|nr:metal-dependent hydrolase [Candidatus Methylomirabilis sp.]